MDLSQAWSCEFSECWFSFCVLTACDRLFCRSLVCPEQWVILQSWFLVWFLAWRSANAAISPLQFNLKIYPFCTDCYVCPSHIITCFYLYCFVMKHCSTFRILCSNFHSQFFFSIFQSHLFSSEAELLCVFHLIIGVPDDQFIHFRVLRSLFYFLRLVFRFGIALYFYTFLLISLMLWKWLAWKNTPKFYPV